MTATTRSLLVLCPAMVLTTASAAAQTPPQTPPQKPSQTSPQLAPPATTPPYRLETPGVFPGARIEFPQMGSFVKGAPVRVFESGITYVFDFFNTKCNLCAAAAPNVAEWEALYAPKGFRFIAVTWESEDVTRAWLTDPKHAEHAPAWVVSDPAEAAAKAMQYPTFQNQAPRLFVVRDGVVLWYGHPEFAERPLAEIAAEAGLPEGVLSIIAESGAEGAQLLTTDPAVNMVSFTGSTETGSIVAGQAAPSMKRLQLELGGKSAQIYLPDRVEAAFSAAVGVCIAHAGQGCVLGTRIFVPEAEKAKVLGAMAASMAYLKIGDSTDPETTMGPVISEAQAQRCERYVKLAVDAGATVVSGGKRADRPGYFFEPTILDVPDNKNPSAQDEIFGPVVSVIGYRDVEHAIEMANDSSLGLSGYVYGKDARAALDVAKRIRTGTINVNAFFASANSSSGGVKMSGIGRERGVEGIRAFQDVQVMNLGSAV